MQLLNLSVCTLALLGTHSHAYFLHTSCSKYEKFIEAALGWAFTKNELVYTEMRKDQSNQATQWKPGVQKLLQTLYLGKKQDLQDRAVGQIIQVSSAIKAMTEKRGLDQLDFFPEDVIIFCDMDHWEPDKEKPNYAWSNFLKFNYRMPKDRKVWEDCVNGDDEFGFTGPRGVSENLEINFIQLCPPWLKTVTTPPGGSELEDPQPDRSESDGITPMDPWLKIHNKLEKAKDYCQRIMGLRDKNMIPMDMSRYGLPHTLLHELMHAGDKNMLDRRERSYGWKNCKAMAGTDDAVFNADTQTIFSVGMDLIYSRGCIINEDGVIDPPIPVNSQPANPSAAIRR